MNEVLKKLLLVITAVALFFSASNVIPAISVGKETQDSQIVISTELKDVSESDIKRVRKEAEIALKSIPPILGIEYKKKIKIKIVEKGICKVQGGVILLPIWHVKNKKAAIVHEVTHKITKHENNRFFAEGLAIYFQEKIGDDNGFPSFDGIPVDDLMKNYKDQLISISKLKNNNEIFRQVGTEQRKIAYIEAGSFIRFLFEAYGDQKLKDLYNTWTLNYKKIYGKDIKELEEEWKASVLGELRATKPKAADVQHIEESKTLIMIQQPQRIYEYGKVKFKVNSGDVLEVVKSKTCRNGIGECWLVRNVSTGETGYVQADLIKSNHKVYAEPVN